MKVYVALKVKPGSFRSVIEGLQDRFLNVRIDGIIGSCDLIFALEIANEKDYYEEITKRMMSDENIKSAQSYVVLKPRQKETKESPSAYVFAHLISGAGEYVQEKLIAYPEVLCVDILAGIYDLVAQVATKDIPSLWKFLGEVAHIQGICRTDTLVVPESYAR
jgi:DNA-binding Lrp family transcriptional regulator